MNVEDIAGCHLVIVYWVSDNTGENGVELKRSIVFGRMDLLIPDQYD